MCQSYIPKPRPQLGFKQRAIITGMIIGSTLASLLGVAAVAKFL